MVEDGRVSLESAQNSHCQVPTVIPMRLAACKEYARVAIVRIHQDAHLWWESFWHHNKGPTINPIELTGCKVYTRVTSFWNC